MTNQDALQALQANDLKEKLLHQRTLLLGSALDQDIGNYICGHMVLLAAEDPRKDISLWINSPGGSVTSMLAIMDVIQTVPNDVRTLALGIAASAGQFLLSAGTPGKRYAMPYSKVLMHQGSAGFAGTAEDIELQAKDLRDIRDTCTALTAEHTRQTPEKIAEDGLRDRWYTAQEAQSYGFFDHIVSSWDEIAPSGPGVCVANLKNCCHVTLVGPKKRSGRTLTETLC